MESELLADACVQGVQLSAQHNIVDQKEVLTDSLSLSRCIDDIDTSRSTSLGEEWDMPGWAKEAVQPNWLINWAEKG